jgi:hypothetical protein
MNPAIECLSLLADRMGLPHSVTIQDTMATVKFDRSVVTLHPGENTPIGWSAEEMAHLGGIVARFPQIQSVYIVRTFMVDTAWQELIRALARSSITHLSVDGAASAAMDEVLSGLVRAHPHLRSLSIGIAANGDLCDAIAQSTCLRKLRVFDRVADLPHILRTNRHIRSVSILSDSTAQLASAAYIALARNNWALTHFTINGHGIPGCVGPPFRQHARIIRNLTIALLSMRLPAYVVLWILDWLPPMSTRFEWRGDPAHDPFHGKKIALIEGLVASYRRLKG